MFLGIVFFILFFIIKWSLTQVQMYHSSQFISQVSKGSLEYFDKLTEVAQYGMKHGHCYAELDHQIQCVTPYELVAAVKVKVMDQRDVEIQMPEPVLRSGPTLRWRVTIQRRPEVCNSWQPYPPAIVTLYVACQPIHASPLG